MRLRRPIPPNSSVVEIMLNADGRLWQERLGEPMKCIGSLRPAQGEALIQEYIESFYNRQRRHSRLGNVPPALFAQNFSKQPRAA
jgi:hypothetical protein